MPSIKDILNSYNSINNNKPLTIKDLMVANANSQLQETPENLSPYPTNQPQIPLSQNIPIQSQYNIPTDKINIPSIAQNRIPISPEMEPYNKPPKPYSISDIASYWKADEKTGEKPSKWSAFLKSIGTLLNTKEGMNLIGLATLGTGGSPFMAKAFADQGSQIEAGNIQNKEQYNKYLENIRKTNTEYDMKLLDILGKEGYQRLKGEGRVLTFDPTSRNYIEYYTDENGEVKTRITEPTKEDIINKAFKPEKSAEEKIKEAEGITEAKGKAYNQALLERENLLRNPKTQTAAAVKQAQQNIELSALPQKQQLEIEKATKQEQNIRLNKLNEMNKVIDFFENKINEIPVGSGLGGRLQGAMIGLEGKAGLNPKATAYQANLEGLRSQIARGLGEVGNLAENEQKYAMSLLPNITDNMEVRQQKIQNFRDYIKVKLDGNITNQNISKNGNINKNIENFRNKYNY